MAVGTAALVGAGASLAGGLLSSRQSAKNAENAAQAAQFNPFNVNLPGGGGASFDGNTATGNLSPQEEAIRSQLLGLSGGNFGGTGADQSVQQFAGDFTAGNLGGVANQFLGAGGGVQDALGLFNSQNAQQQQQQQALQAQFAGQLGDRTQQQRSSQLFGQGQGLLQSDFQGQADQRLDLLRQQAQPFEDRAADAQFQRLFSQGRLGSTGGGRDLEAFGRGLGQADLGRQVESQNFADTLRQQDRSLGLGLTGQSLGFSGQGTNEQGLFGSLAAQQQGIGSNLNSANFQNNLAGGQFDLSRGGQRLAGLQGLFNFGQGAESTNINQGLAGLQGQQSIDQGLRNNIALGGNIGGTQASAGNNAGRFLNQSPSTAGGLLSGLGSSLSQFGASPQAAGQLQPFDLSKLPKRI